MKQPDKGLREQILKILDQLITDYCSDDYFFKNGDMEKATNAILALLPQATEEVKEVSMSDIKLEWPKKVKCHCYDSPMGMSSVICECVGYNQALDDALKVHQSVVTELKVYNNDILKASCKVANEKDKRIAELEAMCGKEKLEWIHAKDVRVKELEDRIKVCTVITEKAIAQRDCYKKALQYIVDHAWVKDAMDELSYMKWINEFVDVAKSALKEEV